MLMDFSINGVDIQMGDLGGSKLFSGARFVISATWLSSFTLASYLP